MAKQKTSKIQPKTQNPRPIYLYGISQREGEYKGRISVRTEVSGMSGEIRLTTEQMDTRNGYQVFYSLDSGLLGLPGKDANKLDWAGVQAAIKDAQ